MTFISLPFGVFGLGLLEVAWGTPDPSPGVWKSDLWEVIGSPGTHPHGRTNPFVASWVFRERFLLSEHSLSVWLYDALCHVTMYGEGTHQMPSRWAGTLLLEFPASPMLRIKLLFFINYLVLPCHHVAAAVSPLFPFMKLLELLYYCPCLLNSLQSASALTSPWRPHWLWSAVNLMLPAHWSLSGSYSGPCHPLCVTSRYHTLVSLYLPSVHLSFHQPWPQDCVSQGKWTYKFLLCFYSTAV